MATAALELTAKTTENSAETGQRWVRAHFLLPSFFAAVPGKSAFRLRRCQSRRPSKKSKVEKSKVESRPDDH
jgi:hypothetical protein